MVKIMIVDDEPAIRTLISLYLTDESFEIVEQSNANDGLQYLETEAVDCIISDIMMPGMDGYSFCEIVRQTKQHLPILMLTAKAEQQDLIKGYHAGTDDYLTKPFDPVELVLRVKALLRRANINISQKITLGNCTLDRVTYELSNEYQSEVLPLKEFELLFLLADHLRQVFTREHLLEKIWGMDYEGSDRTVDVHIRKLRERIEKLQLTIEIQTLRGIGYRLEVIE